MSTTTSLKQIFKKVAPSLRFLSVVFLLIFDGKYCAAAPIPEPDIGNGHMSLPNRDRGLERILGFGIAFPYPYYQKPRFRYPVYDRAGRGRTLYGYGGSETFKYKVFTPIEGHH